MQAQLSSTGASRPLSRRRTARPERGRGAFLAASLALAAAAVAVAVAATAPASAQTVVYDNLTTNLNNGLASGGTANVGGSTLKTLMIADDLTLAPGSAGRRVNGYSFTIRNFGGAAVPARTLVTVYADNGANAPGALLYSGAFTASSHAPGLQVVAFSPPAAGGNLFTIPAGQKIWAGVAYDDNAGATGATAGQMDSLGQGAYGPPALGSSANTLFVSNAAGNYAVNNPVGHPENPGVSLGWRFTVRDPVAVAWNVAGGGAWNSIANNWSGGTPDATRYVDGDDATFGNAAGGTITFAGNIAAGSTTVNAAAGTYTFSGPAGLATGPLVKQGFGRLVLANLNSSTAPTTVWNSGTIAANGGDAHLTLNYPFGGGNVISGDLHIGVADAAATGVAKVSLAQPNQVADTGVVYFDSPSGRFAYLSLRGNSETVAGIVSTASGGAIENGNLNGAIAADATLTLAPPAGVTHAYSGIIRNADSGGGTGKLNLVVNGPGTQVLGSGAGAAYTYTGATTVNGGTLRVDGSIAASAGVTVANAGAVEFGSTQSVKALTMTGAAQARFTGGGAVKVLTVGDGSGGAATLAVTQTAKLDLGGNAAIVDHAAADDAATLQAVRGLIVKGYNAAGPTFNNGDWKGNGITSGVAQGDTSRAVGYARAGELTLAVPGKFLGSPVDGSAVVARLTLAGDANLDGLVDFGDLIRLAQNYNTAVAATTDSWWFSGDFTYDGVTDFADLIRLAQNYNTALPAGAIPGAPADFQTDLAAAFAAVPEPAAVSPLVIAAAALAGRRRRRTSGPSRPG